MYEVQLKDVIVEINIIQNYNFYYMKSKLQTTIGELYMIKNQIRAELNLIRPKQLPCFAQKKQKPAKRLFTSKFNETTSIANPSAEKSKSLKSVSKRLFDRENILFTQTNRIIEKKHYGRHYADNVNLENNLKHKTCSYFNVRQPKQNAQELRHNTSLSGIGMHDKSLTQLNRSRKRIFHEKLVFNRSFI